MFSSEKKKLGAFICVFSLLLTHAFCASADDMASTAGGSEYSV